MIKICKQTTQNGYQEINNTLEKHMHAMSTVRI